MLVKTPFPPYYAVIFTSLLEKQHEGYAQMADKMFEFVLKQEDFLGFEAVREELGITVSYWSDLGAIKKWKNNSEHTLARQKGKSDWYKYFKVRIAKIERDYESN